MRDIERKLDQVEPGVRERIAVWLERAQRLYTQRPKDKQKLYALHAPEVECIGKGKARQAYEFGVKVGIAVTACKGLVVGARSFPGNPYDGDTLAEQLEQTRGLLQDVSVEPTVAIVDLGDRGREVDGVQVLHRGKAKTLTRRQWRWIKRRQAVEPVIGHLKDDCRLHRCRLKGVQGDALHVLGCAAGYNLRWLLRWIAFLRAWMRAMGWSSLSAVLLSPTALGTWHLALGTWHLKGIFQGRLHKTKSGLSVIKRFAAFVRKVYIAIFRLRRIASTHCPVRFFFRNGLSVVDIAKNSQLF